MQSLRTRSRNAGGTDRRRTRSFAAVLALVLPAATADAQYEGVAAGLDHSLALRCDGSIVAWGNNNYGQCNVPALPSGLTYVEIAAGGARDPGYSLTYGFSVARRSDGSVVAWGNNTYGQSNTPALPPGLSCVEIDAGSVHALARLSDGSIVAWGDNTYGQCNVPALPPGVSYVEVSAGGWDEELEDWTFIFPSYFSWHRGHSVARRSDGSVVAWGDNTQGQLNVPALPPGLTYSEVSAGSDHTAARRSDGSVVAWGDNTFGQCDVPALPPGLTYEWVRAGGGHTVARRSDGSIVQWGNIAGTVPTPPPGVDYEDIAVGGASVRWTIIYDFVPPDSGAYAYSHSIGLRSDGSLAAWGSDYYGQATPPTANVIDLGNGLAGSSGVPVLTGSLDCSPGAALSVTLHLGDALQNGTTTLVIGNSTLGLPFMGGTFVPSPDIVIPGLPIGATGTLVLSGTLPPNIPAGISLYFQHWIADPAGPANYSASNGLSVTTF